MWLPSRQFVTKVQLPNMYLRNLHYVTDRSILHSTYHRTWETGLGEVTRVSSSNPLFFPKKTNQHEYVSHFEMLTSVRTLESNQPRHFFAFNSPLPEVR